MKIPETTRYSFENVPNILPEILYQFFIMINVSNLNTQNFFVKNLKLPDLNCLSVCTSRSR